MCTRALCFSVSLSPLPNHDLICASVRDTPAVVCFLEHLAEDLRSAGWAVSLGRASGVVTVEGRPVEYSTHPVSTARRPAGDERRPALCARARRSRLGELFVDGVDLNLDAIVPTIILCKGRPLNDIFSYVKLTQAVPSAPRVGRRIRFIVMDTGQKRPALIGAAELASPVFTLGCRDRYLGWSRAAAREVKVTGLRRILDLATCQAVPPYNTLRAGKLLASLAVSSVITEEFERRYREPLLGVVATCATGLHYPHVNRLTIRPGGLYRRIGATAGYSTSLFRAPTLAAARALIQPGLPAQALGPAHAKGIPLLRNALRLCGLPEEPILRGSLHKGVYFGEVSPEATESLRFGGDRSASALSSAEAIRWWRHTVLARALRREDLRSAVDACTGAIPPTEQADLAA